MVNLIDTDDLSIFSNGAVYCLQIKHNLLGSHMSLHRICRTDKAFLFWSDGTVTSDTQIRHCLNFWPLFTNLQKT